MDTDNHTPLEFTGVIHTNIYSCETDSILLPSTFIGHFQNDGLQENESKDCQMVSCHDIKCFIKILFEM